MGCLTLAISGLAKSLHNPDCIRVRKRGRQVKMAEQTLLYWGP